MGYKMKHKKGAFPFKTDLTKKTGLGPTERLNRELVKDDDDQSREAAEDAMGVDTNIKMPKVMKDGAKNKTVQDPKYFDLEKYDDDRG